MLDVVVVGGGPAGRAISAACGDVGLRVCLVDPAPRRGWSSTLSAWLDELPAAIADTATAAVAGQMWTYASTARQWARPYAVLDNQALFGQLWHPEVTEISGKVRWVDHGSTGSTDSTVHLRDGRRIAVPVVIDASGSTRVLSGGRSSRTSAQQSAVGVILHQAAAEHLITPGSGMFMDWRQPQPAGRSDTPTFLYAVPLSGDRVLLEETCLARRPALPLPVLRERLRARLDRAGVRPTPEAVEERVLFPVDDPPPRRAGMAPSGLIPFGAAAGFVHPASGFSVAASLRLAPWVAAAIRSGLPAGPAAAASAAWSILWPAGHTAAHALQRKALDALLAMPPEIVPEFFDIFFGIDEHYRRAFLSPQAGFTKTATAMAELFRSAPGNVRRHLVRAALPGARTNSRADA